MQAPRNEVICPKSDGKWKIQGLNPGSLSVEATPSTSSPEAIPPGPRSSLFPVHATLTPARSFPPSLTVLCPPECPPFPPHPAPLTSSGGAGSALLSLQAPSPLPSQHFLWGPRERMRVRGCFQPVSSRERGKNWHRFVMLGPSFLSPTGQDATVKDSASTHPVCGD